MSHNQNNHDHHTKHNNNKDDKKNTQEYSSSQIESKLQNIDLMEEKNVENLTHNIRQLPDDVVDPNTTDSNNNNNASDHHPTHLPNWKYKPVSKDALLSSHNASEGGGGEGTETNPRQKTTTTIDESSVYSHPPLTGPNSLDLGSYRRNNVTNCYGLGKDYFDVGLRLMFSYQHELAAKFFLACSDYNKDCALVHGFVALCHSPNYNFKGTAYYYSACHYDDVYQHDLLCAFPSEQVADRHSKLAISIIEQLRKKKKVQRKNYQSNNSKRNNNNNKQKKNNQSVKTKTSNANINNQTNHEKSDVVGEGIDDAVNVEKVDEGNEESCSQMISDVESQLLSAIRTLTCQPGVDPDLSEQIVGRPYADAMAKVYRQYPLDPDIAYFYAESLMVLNAWQLYEYPSGVPRSPDVNIAHEVLQKALQVHPNHAGLCHMFVHLSEMSTQPSQALIACNSLRYEFPNAGHLIHMATHVDVLVGDYESCVKYNIHAKDADLHVMECHPLLAGAPSFYFGYIVHNFHMGVYGSILGGFEQIGMKLASEMSHYVNEKVLNEYPDLCAYLETYSALEVHIMIRFGRWERILELSLPQNEKLMLYRTASIRYGRALAFAMLGQIEQANTEAKLFDLLRSDPICQDRILHNNTVADLLKVDSVMMQGELLYRSGQYQEGLQLLKKAVTLQDHLIFDEPWGKMQPIRHAYGGLLLEQNYVNEAIEVFCTDLKFHPLNPWALVGLISSLKKKKHTLLLQKQQESTNGYQLSAGSDNNHVCNCTDNVSSPKKTNVLVPNFVECDDVNELDRGIHLYEEQLHHQRQSIYADYDIVVPCECCQKLPPSSVK